MLLDGSSEALGVSSVAAMTSSVVAAVAVVVVVVVVVDVGWLILHRTRFSYKLPLDVLICNLYSTV